MRKKHHVVSCLQHFFSPFSALGESRLLRYWLRANEIIFAIMKRFLHLVTDCT